MAGVLSGQTAVITGGSRGLGLAMASALAHAGADIALLDVLPAVADTAAILSAETGRTVISAVCNVVDPSSVSDAFDQISYAGLAPTILINSAGISSGAPALDLSLDEWSRIMDVNLTGTFLMCQQFGRRVHSAGQQGAIVNIASISGLAVNVPQAQVAYNTSKAAVIMLTKSLAIEWLPIGIRVNAIAPGYFESDMTKDFTAKNPEVTKIWLERTPAGRMGQPAELGPLAVYLCSPDAAFMVGQTIAIDGGYTVV